MQTILSNLWKSDPLPFIAIISNSDSDAKLVQNAFKGSAIHYKSKAKLPAFVPKIYIGTDSGYANTIREIEAKRHSKSNQKFLYSNSEIEDFLTISIKDVSDISWAFPRLKYSQTIPPSDFAFSSDKNAYMSVFYSFFGGIMHYRIMTGGIKHKTTIPFSLISKMTAANRIYAPFIYVANAYLNENKKIMDKYRKINDKQANVKEVAKDASDIGFVEKDKDIFIIKEGKKKQLLREQV